MDKQEAEAGLSPCCVVYDTGKPKKKGANEDTILQTHRLMCVGMCVCLGCVLFGLL